MSILKSKLGEVKKNNNGSLMKIIKYTSCDDIDILFEEYNWIYKNAKYGNFKRGIVRCPYERKVFNIGYLGEGEYLAKQGLKNTKQYEVWRGLLRRCYDSKCQEKHPTYKDCSVCEEWLNFQNFAKWYDENYYEVDGEKMCLDKDILIKGNKIYSPKTCIIVPNNINCLFTKRQNYRGKSLIGVSVIKETGIFRVFCMNPFLKNNEDLGCYRNEKEAFLHYKNYKENIIKRVADHYKDKIPQQLYEAMHRYKVDIDD